MLCSFDRVNTQMCTYACRHDHAEFYNSCLHKGVGMSTLMYTYMTGHGKRSCVHTRAGLGVHTRVCMVKLIFTAQVSIHVWAHCCYVYAQMWAWYLLCAHTHVSMVSCICAHTRVGMFILFEFTSVRVIMLMCTYTCGQECAYVHIHNCSWTYLSIHMSMGINERAWA
jgi:hypothetical protein